MAVSDAFIVTTGLGLICGVGDVSVVAAIQNVMIRVALVRTMAMTEPSYEIAIKAEAWDLAIMLLEMRAVNGKIKTIRDGARSSLEMIADLPEGLSKTEHRPVFEDGFEPWCEKCAADWPCDKSRAKLQVVS